MTLVDVETAFPLEADAENATIVAALSADFLDEAIFYSQYPRYLQLPNLAITLSPVRCRESPDTQKYKKSRDTFAGYVWYHLSPV